MDGMSSYSHGWYAFILSRMVCLHTVTWYAFVLSRMVCLRTVMDGMSSYSHGWYAFVLWRMVCLHTVTDGMPSYCHGWYAFELSCMYSLDGMPSYYHVCIPGLYYKQRTIDFFIVCFVDDPPVISFWCCYFSFCVEQFFVIPIRAVCCISHSCSDQAVSTVNTPWAPWTRREHRWQFSHFNGQAQAVFNLLIIYFYAIIPNNAQYSCVLVFMTLSPVN